MTRIIRKAIWGIASLLLASCASYRGFPDRVMEPEKELGNLEIYFSPKKVAKYEESSEDDVRRRIRNEIINGRIAAIDLQFYLFQKKLREEGLNLNVGTDAIILGLGAAGALVSGGTSQVLSATSAAVAGLHGSIDKNAFYEQAMPALFAQMIAQRKKVLVRIRAGLVRSTSDYPLQQGFADLEDYQYAGSIPGAIATIVDDAGEKSAQASKSLDKTFHFASDPVTQSLDAFLGPPPYAKEKIDKVKACWPEARVPRDTLFVDFRRDPEFADERVAVMECLTRQE
jgi:hypothetical protein